MPLTIYIIYYPKSICHNSILVACSNDVGYIIQVAFLLSVTVWQNHRAYSCMTAVSSVPRLDSFLFAWWRHCSLPLSAIVYSAFAQYRQDAQLSQRPRCRVRYSFGQKWKTGTGIQYFTYITGLSSTTVIICRIRWKKTQNKGYYDVQGHRSRYQSKARMRIHISDQ